MSKWIKMVPAEHLPQDIEIVNVYINKKSQALEKSVKIVNDYFLSEIRNYINKKWKPMAKITGVTK